MLMHMNKGNKMGTNHYLCILEVPEIHRPQPWVQIDGHKEQGSPLSDPMISTWKILEQSKGGHNVGS